MKIIESTDFEGNTYEVVVIENEDGSITSMSKEHYDTLASESANDPAGNK